MHHGISAREDDTAVIPLRGRTLPELAAAPVDLDDLNSPHTLAVLSIPPGATVLDIGCGPGVVARALAARGCKVWGLEIDPRRAGSARNYCIAVLEADVEAVSLSAAFNGMTFDAVLCLDVLEHLRDPTAVLTNAAAVLAPGGSVLLSIPNVTHGALRLELLSGKFRYRSSGLLDRGHLRFFDAEGVNELIRQAGLRAESRLRVMRRLDQTEFDVDLASIPSALRTTLERDVDALTYQFFVIATPARGPQSANGGITLLERQRARIDELAAALEEGAAYARHVEKELAGKDARLREVQGAVEHIEREFEARGARLTEMEQVLAGVTRISEDTESYVRHLEGELRKRAGDIAIRDDAMSVLRAHIETAERTISERDREAAETTALLRARTVEAERSIADREALLQIAERSVAESRQLSAHLSWVLQQPRHRLAASSASALRRWMPLLHRLLRPLVMSGLYYLPTSPESPPHRGAD